MRAGVIGLRGDRPDDNGPRSDAGIFIPPETAFPDLAATKETLKDLLSDLDVDEVLFTAARLNLILTEQIRDENTPWWQRQRRLQSELASSILPPEALDRVDSYVRSERIHAGNWVIFHRGQLIEFMRWAALYCRIVNEPENRTLDEVGRKEKFAKALLIASALWDKRVYQGRLKKLDTLSRTRDQLLDRFRESFSETTLGPDLTKAYVRSRAIWSRFLAARPEFAEEFKRAGALSIEDYFGVFLVVLLRSLGLGADMSSRVAANRVFSESDLAQSPPWFIDAIRKFLNIEGQEVDVLAGKIKALGDVPSPTLRLLRRAPILRSRFGTSIAADATLLSEKITAGPLFLVLTDENANDLFRIFGQAYEDFCNDILEGIYPYRSTLLAKRFFRNWKGTDAAGNDVELADACLCEASSLILFESKGVWLPDSASANPEQYQAGLRERYARVARGKGKGRVNPKGTEQLSRTIQNLSSGVWRPKDFAIDQVTDIYPVLLSYDYRLDAPLTPYFLAREFARGLGEEEAVEPRVIQVSRFRVAPLITMTLDDLEDLESSLENFSLCELLREFSQNYPDRLVTLHNYLVISRFQSKIVYSKRVREEFSRELKNLQQRFEESDGASRS